MVSEVGEMMAPLTGEAALGIANDSEVVRGIGMKELELMSWSSLMDGNIIVS